MKTKIVLMSLGAVAILVLVSFTNVIGIQSTPSSSLTTSPLFRIRTTKATTNEYKRVITSNYLGKGIHIMLFPARDSRTEILQKVIDKIRTMNDFQYNRFVVNVVQLLSQHKNMKNAEVEEITKWFNEIRENPEILYWHGVISNENATYQYLRTLCWFPGCLIMYIIVFIEIIIVLILAPIPTAVMPTCPRYICD